MKTVSVKSANLCQPTSKLVRSSIHIAAGALTLCALAFLSGCSNGLGGANGVSPVPTPQSHSVGGYVHGGQQPIGGATIQLYQVGNTGYGSNANALLTTTVTTSNGTGVGGNVSNANNTLPIGYFTITNLYSCPGSGTNLVYITSTGGNPIAGSAANAQATLMAALGSCTALQAGGNNISINIDEVTTVASVWALSRFTSSYSAIGASSTNQAGIINAFATVNTLVNTSSGTAPGTYPTGATVPASELNDLANAIASCINSIGGLANDNSGSNCTMLFQYATPPSGTAPTDTLTAALDMALYPYNNVSNICSMGGGIGGPFQPTLACNSLPNFLVGINYNGGGLSAPNSIAVDSSGNVWLANGGANSVAELSNTGSPVSTTPFTVGGLSGPSGLAIDPTGNVWVSNKTGNSLTELSSAGAAVGSSPFTGDGVSAPTGVAIDGLGNVWLSNSGNSSVSEFNSSGVVVGNFTPDAGLNAPVGIAIDSH